MKHLKKAAAILMLMILSTLIFTGCGAGGSSVGANAITGSWKCSALDMGSGDVLSQLGSSYSENILFYALEDGSCLLDMAGQQLPMKWKWMEKNQDFKLTITLAGFAEANGMTEEDMKAQIQGSDSSDIETEQSYRAEIKDGKVIMNMASFYDESHKADSSSAAEESSYKMEFTFQRTGDAPKSLDEVKTPAAAASAPAAEATDSTAAAAE